MTKKLAVDGTQFRCVEREWTDPLVYTNALFMLSASIAFSRKLYLFAFVQLLLFAFSTVYHKSHERTCSYVDLATAYVAIGIVVGTTLMNKPSVHVMAVMVSLGVLTLLFKYMDNYYYSVSHSWFHMLAGTLSIFYATFGEKFL